MKKFLVAALTIVSLLPFTSAVYAATDDTRLRLISQNCSSLHTLLDQLQRRDLVARTNRGRAYEAQITQIDAFSQRLRNNNILSQPLDGPANNFKNAVDTFRTAYVQYDDHMTTLLQIDCRSKPEDFAAMLDQVRGLRDNVGAQVSRGEDSLATYRQALVDMQATLPVPLDGGSNQ
jgi:hypothetical protein